VAFKIKKIIFYIFAFILIFAAGFFSRGLFNRERVSGADEYHKNIQSELRRADKSNNRLEENIGSARSGVTASIELSGTIGIGLDGIERSAVENTDLLGRAERILLDAREREQGSQD